MTRSLALIALLVPALVAGAGAPAAADAPTGAGTTAPSDSASPAVTPPVGHPRIPIRLDMGLSGRSTPGAANCGAWTRSPYYAWFDGMVRDGIVMREQDTWFADHVEGEDATFVIGAQPADSLFQLTLSLGEAAKERGPVSIFVNDLLVADSISTAAGEQRDITVTTGTVDGRISIRLQARSCRGFALCGLALTGPKPAWLGYIFPQPVPTVAVPPPEMLPNVTTDDARRLLRDAAEFLVKHHPIQGGFSYHGAWYQNAYPIRTLLAASQLLNEPRFAEPAIEALDRFVNRQGADGNWLSVYFGSAACDTFFRADSASSNLADIGTMTFCTAAAIPYVDEERGRKYLEAIRRYVDDFSLPLQFEDGAFPNGRWAGREYAHPYSVATATQTSTLASLYSATNERRYLEAAEKGARWLTNSTLEDGRIVMHPHDHDGEIVKEAVSFGDMFYIAEALILVRQRTGDEDLRKAIDTTIDRWLYGSEGLLINTRNGYWWDQQSGWGNSKMAGMLYVLATHPRIPTDPGLRTWLRRGVAWMSDLERGRIFGIMMHPSNTHGEYSLVATGFAGIGLAEVIARDALPVESADE